MAWPRRIIFSCWGFYFTTLCRSYFALKISPPLFILKFILKYRFVSTHTDIRDPSHPYSDQNGVCPMLDQQTATRRRSFIRHCGGDPWGWSHPRCWRCGSRRCRRACRWRAAAPRPAQHRLYRRCHDHWRGGHWVMFWGMFCLRFSAQGFYFMKYFKTSIFQNTFLFQSNISK